MLAVGMMLDDDAEFLAASVESFRSAGPVLAFVSRLPWRGDAGDWEGATEVASGGIAPRNRTAQPASVRV